MIFWYAIEKLFMSKIGFNAGTISLAVAVYSGVALLAEIPSGILADRWSRKGVLILSSIALATSSLIGALSNDIATYLVASAVWGIFIALDSGVVESIIYDVLLEERGEAKNYEQEIGKLEIVSSTALIVGSIFGGLIGQFSGLRQTYWISIPTVLLSIVFLWFFKEPKLHKHNQNESLIKHIRLTFGSIFKNKNLLWILISLITSSIAWTMVMEMGQLWLIALFAPVVLLGSINALVSSSFGIGGMLSRFIKSKKYILVGMFASIICMLCLIFSRNILISVSSMFIIMFVIYGINIVLTHKLHDQLPSKVRVGSASAINAIRRLLIIPTSIIFGIVATKYSVFIAGWLLIGLLIIAIMSQIFVKDNTKPEAQNG
jgi:predicted MFS family arabinose efflux permease